MQDFSNTLIVGISSRTLFDLEAENELFQNQGIEEYRRVQKSKENELLEPGTAFHLVRALLNLNKLSENHRFVEVIVMSKNSPETGLRVLNSIKQYGLDITRSAFTGGEAISPYIEAFGVDLFLSKNEQDVQAVIDSRSAAAAMILEPPQNFNTRDDTVRIAFDADAVLFSDDSEFIYKTEGINAFHENELDNENIPLKEGPMGKLLKTLSRIQRFMDTSIELTPLRIAIVTARSSPAHLRVINTLRNWDVYVDEAFFLGGIPKDQILKAFNAHIFFDDQDQHLKNARQFVPSAKVPIHSDSQMRTLDKDKK